MANKTPECYTQSQPATVPCAALAVITASEPEGCCNVQSNAPIASISMMSAGAIPAIRNLFFGDSRALGFVTDTLNTLGTAMIPCAMLVIGAVLQNGPGGKAVVPYRILVGVVVTRLFIIPILGGIIPYALRVYGSIYCPFCMLMCK